MVAWIDIADTLSVYMKASDNYRSETVLSLFTEAANIVGFGFPSRVSTDHGGQKFGVPNLCSNILTEDLDMADSLLAVQYVIK